MAAWRWVDAEDEPETSHGAGRKEPRASSYFLASWDDEPEMVMTYDEELLRGRAAQLTAPRSFKLQPVLLQLQALLQE